MPNFSQQTTESRIAESSSRILALKGKHCGQRCFILGNGPSLALTDLSFLAREITFGINRVYLLFPGLGYSTTYYVCASDLIMEQCGHEIAQLAAPSFLTSRGEQHVGFGDSTMFFREPGRQVGYSFCPHEFVFGGGSGVFVALQIAYFLGFTQAILVGVDANYRSSGRLAEERISDGNDADHFAPDYFPKGFRYRPPLPTLQEYSFRLAQLHWQADNRQILDATVAGQLTVFPKVAYESLF